MPPQESERSCTCVWILMLYFHNIISFISGCVHARNLIFRIVVIFHLPWYTFWSKIVSTRDTLALSTRDQIFLKIFQTLIEHKLYMHNQNEWCRLRWASIYARKEIKEPKKYRYKIARTTPFLFEMTVIIENNFQFIWIKLKLVPSNEWLTFHAVLQKNELSTI